MLICNWVVVFCKIGMHFATSLECWSDFFFLMSIIFDLVEADIHGRVGEFVTNHHHWDSL